MILFIPSLEIIKVVLQETRSKGTPDLNISLWIAASATDGSAVNCNGIKTLLVGGLITFPIKYNPVFINGPKTLPKNPPDFPILYKWVFDSFILAEELFAKALWSFETYV